MYIFQRIFFLQHIVMVPYELFGNKFSCSSPKPLTKGTNDQKTIYILMARMVSIEGI